MATYVTLQEATVGDTLYREPKGKNSVESDSGYETLRQKDYRKRNLWRDRYKGTEGAVRKQVTGNLSGKRTGGVIY